MNIDQRVRASGAAGLALIAASLASPVAQAATLATATDTVFIPYASSVSNGQLFASPNLNVSLNGGSSLVYTMDTGSTGIAVSKDAYTYSGGSPIGTGSITYNSSGVTLNGQYYQTTVDIFGGGHSASASVPVLVIDSQVTCPPAGGGCSTILNPTGVAYFGVGFGQEAAGQPDGTPDKNPFLHINKIDGQAAAPSQGYLLTSTGVSLGLTAANIAQFAPGNLVQLTWSSTYQDWKRTPVTLTAGGVATTGGSVLPDTGIPYMFVQPAVGAVVQTIPAASGAYPCNTGSCAAPGETFVIAIGNDPNNPAFTYTLTIGPGNTGAPIAQPIAPAYVHVLPDGTPSDAFSTVNTSFHFYNAVNYAYDYTNGVTAFVGNTLSVPEPMSGALLGVGLLALLGVARRKTH